ncbi:TRAP transporter small permease [Thalassospira povalilytica]|uniref:TRAP transporter small permease n=1 Tax=Thalassospira povalilytica TaxID=732237 RepID=UPI001D193F91|nr:TRAP transporter small permease [Thalassospira povalilytica]MCC4242277.1 TRAP transporter small permease [Thalassospira povalilytica]
MRRSLNYLFKFSAGLAAVFMVAIALLILAQSLGRLVGIAVHDANELAGFCLAAGTFLSLGPALRAGTHIRVMIILSHLQGGLRRVIESITLLAATFLGGYFAWWMAVLAEESFSYGDTSPGVLAFPLWIPQAAMAFGLIVFTIGMIEALVDTVAGRQAAFAAGEANELNE